MNQALWCLSRTFFVYWASIISACSNQINFPFFINFYK